MPAGDFGKWARKTGSHLAHNVIKFHFFTEYGYFSLLYHINNSIHPLSHLISSHAQSHAKRCPGLNLLPLDSHYNPSLQPDSPTLRLSLTSASAPTISDNTFAWKCTASDERGILLHKN
jgi:hypothetical protein